MKKLLILLLFILLPTYNHTVYAEVDGEFYGKIASENVYLYSSPSSTSPLFQLPYSYFVKINDVSESYYAVTYKDLTGYVLKSEVRLMEGTPNTPYLNTSFSISTCIALNSKGVLLVFAICAIIRSLVIGEFVAFSGNKFD